MEKEVYYYNVEKNSIFNNPDNDHGIIQSVYKVYNSDSVEVGSLTLLATKFSAQFITITSTLYTPKGIITIQYAITNLNETIETFPTYVKNYSNNITVKIELLYNNTTRKITIQKNL